MENYREKALKIVESRRKNAEAQAEKAFKAAVDSDPLLTEIQAKISENSQKLVTLYGQSEKLSDVRKNISVLKNELYSRMKIIGVSPEDFSPHYRCKLCGDRGFVKGRPCRCLAEIEKRLAFEKLNREIPLENTDFSNFDLSYYPEDAREQAAVNLDFCKSYAAAFRKNAGSILMTGNTGLGKTHLSLSIAKSVIAKGCSVIYGSAQNFLSKVESEHFSKTEERGETLSSLINCDLLVFDDLGTEFSSAFVLSTVYSIINTRLLSSKPTIISTNLSLEEIKSRYGDRVASRIIGSYDILFFSGKDIRLIKKMEEL